MARQPQIKDVIILDEQKYVIGAMIAEEDAIVLTPLGGPRTRTFVLKGAQLRWWDMVQAWRPVSFRDFFEADERAFDQHRQ